MRRTKYFKTLFLIAGLWNVVAALICWIGSIFMASLFFDMFGMQPPPSLFPFHAMFGFIIFFGVGYFIVSHDVSKNHGIIVIGMLGKIIFCIDCIITFLLKEANIMLVSTGIVDLVFVILFIDFLLAIRKGTKQVSA